MITDFLKTKRTPEELRTALYILREFKRSESMEEYCGVAFAAWAKLEQLEEFLSHLVEGEPLAADTLAYMATQHKSEDKQGSSK